MKTLAHISGLRLLVALILLSTLSLAGKKAKLAKWKAAVKEYKMHSPKEFYDMIDASKVYYKVQAKKIEAPIDFIPVESADPLINPFYNLTSEFGGTFLIEDKPKGKIKKYFKKADKHLFHQRYDEAVGMYREALDIDSTYFKTWSYLGNTYYLMGQYEKALRYLTRAVELNDIGFQEYCFLADVYLSMGDLLQARNYIAYAYMLNKLNPEVLAILNDILDNIGYMIRKDRLQFPLNVIRVNRKTVEVNFPSDKDFNFVALGNCLACWQMEKRFKHLWWGYEEKEHVNETMIKECLLNQAVWTDGLIREGKNVSQRERMLHEAVRDGYLSSLLVWEIGASQDPEIIYYLDRVQRKKIVDYIKRYVFVRK